MDKDRIEQIENELDVIKNKLEELFDHLDLDSVHDYDDEHIIMSVNEILSIVKEK